MLKKQHNHLYLVFFLRRTLTYTTAVGRKQFKDRVTVGVCNNADGSDKYRLCIIGKFKRPRAFGKNFNPNSIVDYYYNHKGWMTIQVFDDWFNLLNKRMKVKTKKLQLFKIK